MERILVSSCLLGEPVRFDGRGKRRDDPVLVRWRAENRLVSCCPEVSGGLPVPRPPAEISAEGRVRTRDGRDVTAMYERGANDALAPTRRFGIRVAVLKEL